VERYVVFLLLMGHVDSYRGWKFSLMVYRNVRRRAGRREVIRVTVGF